MSLKLKFAIFIYGSWILSSNESAVSLVQPKNSPELGQELK